MDFEWFWNMLNTDWILVNIQHGTGWIASEQEILFYTIKHGHVNCLVRRTRYGLGLPRMNTYDIAMILIHTYNPFYSNLYFSRSNVLCIMNWNWPPVFALDISGLSHPQTQLLGGPTCWQCMQRWPRSRINMRESLCLDRPWRTSITTPVSHKRIEDHGLKMFTP